MCLTVTQTAGTKHVVPIALTRKADLMYIKKSEYSAMQAELKTLRLQAEVNSVWTEIKKIDPQPGEFVIVRVENGKVKLDAFMSFIRNFKKKFPDNQVIGLSDWVDVEVWNTEKIKTIARELLAVADTEK